MMGKCEVQTDRCVAKELAPITAVWSIPGRTQLNVCRPCLEEQIRLGEWRLENARVRPRAADLAVYDSSGHLKLVVEVKKGMTEPDLPWDASARIMHRNLFFHGGIPSAEYFLLINFPHDYALWKVSKSSIPGQRPDFEGHFGDELLKYWKEIPEPIGKKPRAVFEEAVAAWLRNLIESKDTPHDAYSLWLSQSGLLGEIRGGSIQTESLLSA